MSLIKVKSRGTNNVTGRKNIIINGAMRVAQRGTSTTGVTGNPYPSTDRMKFYESSDLVATVAQVSDAPSGSGFTFSHKITATTADSSIGSGDLVSPLQYVIEKQDIDGRLAYGTSSAKTMAMSFWIKSNVTGTYTVSAYRSAAPARIQAQTYTINSANTWEYKVLIFHGDTAEAIDDNMAIYFNGLVGSNFTSSSTTSGWATYNTANWAGGHTATWGDTANDTWQITGLQLEVGEQASDFEHRSFGEDLTLCQRYYTDCDRWFTQGYAYGTGGDGSGSSLMFPTTMRAAPTISQSSGTDGGSSTAYVMNFITTTGCSPEAVNNGSGQPVYYFAYINADAEL